MNKKRLMKEIRGQLEILEKLIDKLQNTADLRSRDFFLYELATREVEKNLAKIRKLDV